MRADGLQERFRIKLESNWGNGSWASLAMLTDALASLEIRGPLSFKDKYFLPYLYDATPDIRVVIGLSRLSGEEGGKARFDVTFTFRSRTIFRATRPEDPWFPVGAGFEDYHEGYVGCLTMRLSHLKWASQEGCVNPSWVIDAEGVSACVEDIRVLVLPRLHRLKSDRELADLLQWALHYQRPAWVKSDGPGMLQLDALAGALARGCIA